MKTLKDKFTIKTIATWLGTIVALITSIQFLLMPAIDAHIETKILEREKVLIEEASGKVSFRTLLSEESGVPKDRIHIAYGEMYIRFRELIDEVGVIQTVIEKEKREVDVGLVFYNGRLWYRWKDGEDYRIRKTHDSVYYWIDDTDRKYKIGLR